MTFNRGRRFQWLERLPSRVKVRSSTQCSVSQPLRGGGGDVEPVLAALAGLPLRRVGKEALPQGFTINTASASNHKLLVFSHPQYL